MELQYQAKPLVVVAVRRLTVDEAVIGESGGELKSTVDDNVAVQIPQNTFAEPQATVNLQVYNLKLT